MRQYVVDAFAERPFSGNPAAVCVVESWPEDALMQNIARENNLSETAFLLPGDAGGSYGLRWFTPGGEIDLCGHATLASAFVAAEMLGDGTPSLSFDTLGGRLSVVPDNGLYVMDFPAYELRRVEVTPEMSKAFGAKPVEAWMGRDLLCVFGDEGEVRGMSPDQDALSDLPGLLQHATARGVGYDCVSRSFAPKLAVPEDPVCGSGHCHIFPYWAERTGSCVLVGYQASSRGGVIIGRVIPGRVQLGGSAVLFSVGELAL